MDTIYKQILKREKISYRQFAKASGSSLRYIYAVCNRKRKPSIKWASRFLKTVNELKTKGKK